MPFQFIGSTSVLRPGQCQNDICITHGDPNFPVLGDEARASSRVIESYKNIFGIKGFVVVIKTHDVRLSPCPLKIFRNTGYIPY